MRSRLLLALLAMWLALPAAAQRIDDKHVIVHPPGHDVETLEDAIRLGHIGGGGPAAQTLAFQLNGGSMLPVQPNFNATGRGVLLADDPANFRTHGTFPAYVVRVSLGSTFTGTVECPDEPPLSSGVMNGCWGDVTSFGGQTFAYGTLRLRGTYDAATPAKTSGGFTLESFYLPADCTALTDKCGPVFNTVQGQLDGLTNTYNPSHPEGNPEIRFAGANYGVKLSKPMVSKSEGWSLNMCSGPRFIATDAGSDAVTAIPGTVSIVVGTSTTHATISGGNLCGGSATCGDGSAILRTGQKVRLISTGAWLPARVVTNVGMDANGTGFTFIPPQVADYSGTAEIATGGIWVFDDQSPTTINKSTFDTATELICGANAVVSCGTFCTPANAVAGRTTGAGYRAVPITMVAQYHQNQMRQTMTIETTCGRNDSALTLGGPNLFTGGAQSSSAGTFEGTLTGCSNLTESMEQLHGEDPNSNADLENGAMVTILAPGFTYKPVTGPFYAGRMFFIGGNDSLTTLDATLVENAMQLVYMPSGGQNIRVTGVSSEASPGGFTSGGATGCGSVACESLANRPAFYSVGEWFANSNDIASYVFNFGRTFFGARKITLIKINSPGHVVRFELNGAIQDADKMLDVTGNTVNVIGNFQCDIGSSGSATSCDGPPAQGKYHQFSVVDLNGDPRWTGKTLVELSGRLGLAQETDDDVNAANTRCQLNGGPGTGGANEPHWAVCPGTTGSLTDGDKGDITVGSSLTTMTIDPGVVTYAKIQDISATDKLLGRSSAGAGSTQEIPCDASCRTLLAITTSTTGGRALMSLAPAADTMPYWTSPTVPATTGLSSFIRTLLDDADAATARATLGITAFSALTLAGNSGTPQAINGGDTFTIGGSLGLTTVASATRVLNTAIDYTQTLAGNPALLAGQCILSTNGGTSGGLLCEGTTADTQEQFYSLPATNGADVSTFFATAASAITDTVGATNTSTLTNKTFDAEAAGNVLSTVQREWFPAAGCSNATATTFFDLPVTTPAVPGCVTGTNTQKGVLDFSDTSGGFSAQTTLAMPVDWTSAGGIDATLYWTTTATTGNAVWQVSTACAAVNATATDDPAFNAAQTVTTGAPGTSPQVQNSAIVGLTLTGCTTGTRLLFHLKVFRDGANAGDTITATARLIGVELTYRRAQ